MLKYIIISVIRVYQLLLSPDKNILVRWGIRQPHTVCVFYPTCSEYMVGSIEKYGVIKGVGKGLHRISRCRKGVLPAVDLP